MENPSTGPFLDRARRRVSRLRPKKGWALLVLAPLILAGCQLPTFGSYKGATSQGQDAFKLWQFFFVMSLIVGGFVMLLILWAVFAYRKKSDEIPRQFHAGPFHIAVGRHRLDVVEVLYTIVPILIVAVLFVFTVITENEVDATPPSPVNITVTAFQWGWQFYYDATGKVVQGTTVEDPQLVVPTGTNVKIQLLSADTIHGFYVPAFNFSRYAQPGVTDQYFNFDVLHDGVYRGQCTQLCGLYHSLMFFSVKSVPMAEFQVWEHQVTGSKPTRAALANSINQLKKGLLYKGQGS